MVEWVMQMMGLPLGEGTQTAAADKVDACAVAAWLLSGGRTETDSLRLVGVTRAHEQRLARLYEQGKTVKAISRIVNLPLHTVELYFARQRARKLMVHNATLFHEQLQGVSRQGLLHRQLQEVTASTVRDAYRAHQRQRPRALSVWAQARKADRARLAISHVQAIATGSEWEPLIDDPEKMN
jgi:hypothetical protein